jgi:Ulp1 family protease
LKTEAALIIAPWHLFGNHWAIMFLVCQRSKNTVLCSGDFIDPLSATGKTGAPRGVMVNMNAYLGTAMKNAGLTWGGQVEWQAPLLVPLQRNGFDCGAFVLAYAHARARNSRFRFSQENMPFLRLRIAHELEQGKLLPSVHSAQGIFFADWTPAFHR